MKRNFENWFKTFRNSIATYKYYVDFDKVYKNVDNIKIELNILNSLIGSKNIKTEFEKIITNYPQTKKCIPIMLAVREKEIYCQDEKGVFNYIFNEDVNKISNTQYSYFMKETGLFNLLEKHLINNLYDYVIGVETGLDSNGRKNRGGHLMEDLVENYIIKAGFIKNQNYFKEVKISEIEKKWKIKLTEISNKGKVEKRFDFVIKTEKNIYLIETNFYTSGGSKLNETARSYKTIALESKNIKNVKFVWFTDGEGWKSAKDNLEETFDVMEDIYNISDLEKNILLKVIN